MFGGKFSLACRAIRLPGVCVFVCLVYFQVFGQAGWIKEYSVNQGLSQSMVTAILQDSQGFVWLGTGSGLNRFDGYQFTVFKHIPRDSSSISSSTIRGITEGDSGNLWVGSETGLNYYIRARNSFIKPFFKEKDLRSISIRPIYFRDGRLVFYGRGNGIWEYDTRKHAAKCLISADVRLTDEYLYANGNAVIFNCTEQRIGYYNRRSHQLHYLKLPAGAHGQCFLFTDDIHVLAGTNHGIYAIDLRSMDISQYHAGIFGKRSVQSIYKDRRGQYWVADEDGLELYDADCKEIASFHDPAFPGLNHILTISSDRADNILAGTGENGMIVIPYNNLKFKYPSEKVISQLSSRFIRSLYADDKEIYAGTFQKGMCIIEKASGNVKNIVIPDVNESIVNTNSISAIVPAEDDESLFIGTANGIRLYNKTTGHFSTIPFGNTLLTSRNVIGIVSTKLYGTLFCTYQAIYQLHKTGGKYNSTILYTSDGYSIQGVYKDINERPVIGFMGMGLRYLDKASGQDLIVDPHGLLEKTNNKITSFYDCANGHKFIGTNNGLLEVDRNYTLIRQYGLKDGLPDLFIYSILNAGGKLWMSTNKGLCSMDTLTNHISAYTVSDGLNSNEFNSGAYYAEKNGTLYFGGVNGFNYFRSEDIRQAAPAVSVIPTQFNVFDVPFTLDTPLSLKHNIHLPWSSNTFSIEASALEFGEPSRVVYSFYLEGSDNGWYVTGNRRMVRYSGIAPGSYTLWAKVANADGIWSQPMKLMHIDILPPFWKTWWFRLLTIIMTGSVFSAIVYAISTRKYRRRLAELRRQQEIEEVRRRLSRDIHDDIGSDLTKISILTEKIKTRTLGNDLEFIKVLDKLTSHTRSVIGNLSEIVWTVNPQHDNLNSMLAYFRNYINIFFEDCIVGYQINFPLHDEEIIVNPELRRNLFLMLKESLNNVVKHSGATHVIISFSCIGRMFEFAVQDNGHGIEETARITFGNGLQNMRKRMDDSNCSIFIDSEYGKGTSVSVKGTIY